MSCFIVQKICTGIRFGSLFFFAFRFSYFGVRSFFGRFFFYSITVFC